ncbi:MAG TPA: GNAT family N-acetyltransferase [Thalassobaculum sp.]
MNDATIHVRPSTDADLAAIHAIYAHHVTHGFGSFEEVPPGLDEMAARRLAVLERGMPHLVAEAGGRVLGYAYAGPYRPRPAYRYTVENSIYVAQEAVGRGVGRALLGALVEVCEAGPWRQMVAVIGDRGNTASIALHASFGFHEAGHLNAVGFKLGRWVDVVIMQRQLGAGDDEGPDD